MSKKEKFPLYLSPEKKAILERRYQEDGSRSITAFIERAVDFYRCDATQVTTIDFDRNKIRGMATALSKRADEISMSLDKCLVNTEVSYEPPFNMNDSFEDILSDFIEKSTAA